MLYSRCGRDWRKEYALTWGDPDVRQPADRQEVSRGHSRLMKRAFRNGGGLTEELKG